MNRLLIAKIAAVLTGAATLFGLEHGLHVSLYIAVPAALIVYMAVKVGIGLLLGIDERAK
jgi:hypothetical protein